MGLAAEQRNTDRFGAARNYSLEIEARLSSGDMARKTHEDLETFVLEAGREWARRMLQEHLDLRADVERRVQVEGSDGIKRESIRQSKRQLKSIVGELDVSRLAYQAPGVAGLHPMDAALGLPPEVYSLGVRKLVAKFASRLSFDGVVEVVHEATGVSIGKRQVEELAQRAAQDFDKFYEKRETDTETTHDLLVITTDGKGIAMRHEDLRPETKKAAEANSRRLQTRLSPGEKPNRKRMAQVAAVYSVASHPRTPADLVPSLRLMKYADALRDGLPVATGVIEGACRSLVQDRMGVTGARWSLTGAEAVLRLRALRSSGDFDEYWKFHVAQDQVRSHDSRYADGELPDPLPPPRRTLRRVK